MSTFIGQLVGFAVIVWLFLKFVRPPLSRMMAKQQEDIREALADSATAAETLANADQAHIKAVEDARAEAVHVTDEARQDSVKIAAQLRDQAASEADRIKAQGAQQVQLLRQQAIRGLRAELGTESVQQAEALVRAHVADPEARAETVDRFLAELEAMVAAGTTSSAAAELGAPLKLRAASREGLTAVVRKFDQVSSGLGVDELGTLADDLTAVAKLLHREPALAKHLGTPTDDTHNGSPQVRLASTLFQGKVSGPAYELVETGVAQRWSAERDVVDALQHVARLALLARADRSHDAEEVEDQLFRFGRILDGEPQLTSMLGDYTVPAEQRVDLLNKVLDRVGSVNSVTRSLLSQTVELLRGERADETIDELAELAILRRGELVANIAAAADLTDSQRTRLADVLPRIYGHTVALLLEIDPELLGGLQITVGDEVIDGAISSRLVAARTGLPD